MNKAYCFFLLMWSTLQVGAQDIKVEGNSEFSFIYEYKVVNANNYFYLIDNGEKKKNKMKITLPEADNSWRINGKPQFITSNLVQIPVAKQSDLLLGKYYGRNFNIFVPTKNGGYFLRNPKDYMGYLFTSFDVNSCFFYADGVMWDARGNKLDYTSYSVASEYTIVRDGSQYAVIGKDCQKLPFQIPEKAKILEFGSSSSCLGFFSDGEFNLLDVQKASQKRYPTFPAQFLDMWATKFDSFWKSLKESKAIPVLTDNQTWIFINEKGEKISESIKADLVFPFVYYQKYAPVNLQGKWGLVDRKGIFVYPCSFDSLLVGNDAYNSIFRRGDTIFRVKNDGSLVKEPTKMNKPSTPSKQQEPNASVCLVYTFRHESNGNNAYILVDLNYKPINLNHEKMSSWVLNAIQSEISGLWEYRYNRVANSWNNPYKADLIFETGCYNKESEYRQKSSKVSVLRKTFD